MRSLYYNAVVREHTRYIWLGVWLFTVPFLGIPGTWKQTLTALTALVLIGAALFARRRTRPERDASLSSSEGKNGGSDGRVEP
ncbi:MAG: hypothetical protein AAB699_02280 [Patescibacteria group bacterium]